MKGRIMGREYPNRPIVGVGAVISCDGKILIVKRGFKPGKGKWSVPGGVVELGESTWETVVREVREECGLEVEVEKLIDVVDNILRDEDGKIRYHFVILNYLARVKGGSLELSEVEEAKWVSLNVVETYDLTESFREFLLRNNELLGKL